MHVTPYNIIYPFKRIISPSMFIYTVHSLLAKQSNLSSTNVRTTVHTWLKTNNQTNWALRRKSRKRNKNLPSHETKLTFYLISNGFSIYMQ